MTANNNSQRLVSIDLLRGLTVMLMIFVNNGAGDSIFHTLQHSKWNGLTLADCVFPSFLFIMGMSTYLSLRKFDFRWSMPVARKILKRAALLFLIGLAINWLDMALGGRPLDFAHLRIWGVMQRLGICYLLVAALALSCKRGFSFIALAGIFAYSELMKEGGYDYDASTNILARVDQAIVGWDHLYHKSPVDPEGLVSTFAAIIHTMVGFMTMEVLNKLQSVRDKTMYLASIGTLALLCGLLACFVLQMPLNKRVWSPSYLFTTIGIVMLVLCLLVAAVDIWGKGSTPRWLNPIKAFGMNPLALYVGSELLAIVVGNFGIKDMAYNGIHAVITNASWAGFAYACLFTTIFAVMGVWMYRRKIFIKL